MDHPRIAWICNSAIRNSETFLVDNLKLLQDFANVKAFSGNQHPDNTHPDVTHFNYDNLPLKWHHIVRRKITGKDVRTLEKRRRCKKQLFQTIQDFKPDLLWIEFGTTAHIASDLIGALKRPYIIAVHGYDISRELRDPWYAQEFVRLANSSLAIVCASHHTRNLCITAGVQNTLCEVIRYPIDGQKLTPTPRHEDQTTKFIHFGRLVEKKGPLQTILAFQQVLNEIPNATLTIIGDGPLRQTIEKRVKQAGIDRSIRIIGALPQKKALEIVRQHTIFCQHSVTGNDGDQEGFALSPAEAALLEKPVISTFHNGIPEHVIHGKTGLLVREWDIEGMASAMKKLAMNKTLAQTMGANGRQHILNLCNPETRKKNLQELIFSSLQEQFEEHQQSVIR